MSAGPVISASRLGKRYELGRGVFRGQTLHEVLSTVLARKSAAGRADRREAFWALENVSFEVARGEVVGVVGRNGAGKSTLLKILSRITAPTTGRAVLHGRLASLLEVGTGFHGELSGRENIFLNGSILGMQKREIERKFDEIVAFAEIDRFLDTPVKRYSSGMYVRLAFAVAAHLDADILLVDEVLAVGDLAFQRKCLGAIETSASRGRTVLFVSHNLGAVRSLCPRVLLLDRGRLEFDGPTAEGLSRYEEEMAEVGDLLAANAFSGPLVGVVRFERFEVRQQQRTVARVDPTLPVEIVAYASSTRSFRAFDVTLAVFRDGVRLFSAHDGPSGERLESGSFRSSFELGSHLLRPGRYTIGFGAGLPASGEWIWGPDAGVIDVESHWDDRLQARDEGALSVAWRGQREPADDTDSPEPRSESRD